jgi:hypothetical protein
VVGARIIPRHGGRTLLEEALHRLLHALDVGRAEALHHPVAADRCGCAHVARRALGGDEAKAETAVARPAAEQVVGQAAGELPPSEAERLERQRHVLADERLLDVERRELAHLEIHQREPHLVAGRPVARHSPARRARRPRARRSPRSGAPRRSRLVHPGQAVPGEVTSASTVVPGAERDQERLLEVGQGHRVVRRGVGERAVVHRHPEAEAPRAA